MQEVTTETFKAEVEDVKTPILIDFSAKWCGPCKLLMPVLEELGQEMAGIKMVKIDVDDHPELAAKYAVRSIPCLVLLNDGNEIGKSIGVQTKAVLKEWIETAMAPKEKK